MSIENLKISGEDLPRAKAEEASKRLRAKEAQKTLDEVSRGVRKMLEEGYNFEEIMESIKRDVEGSDKNNLN